MIVNCYITTDNDYFDCTTELHNKDNFNLKSPQYDRHVFFLFNTNQYPPLRHTLSIIKHTFLRFLFSNDGNVVNNE